MAFHRRESGILIEKGSDLVAKGQGTLNGGPEGDNDGGGTVDIKLRKRSSCLLTTKCWISGIS